MYTKRRTFGYQPIVHGNPEIHGMIENMNKNVTRIGFCVGLLAVGGYFLFKKVNDLEKECEKLKETRK